MSAWTVIAIVTWTVALSVWALTIAWYLRSMHARQPHIPWRDLRQVSRDEALDRAIAEHRGRS